MEFSFPSYVSDDFNLLISKQISVMPNSNLSTASFILVCFHLQPVFHDLCNVLFLLKSRIAKLKERSSNMNFCKKKKSCSNNHGMDALIINNHEMRFL